MNVMQWLSSLGRRAVIPVGGLMGTTITGTSVRANMFDAGLKAESAARLHLEFGTDAVFHVGDVVVEAEVLGAPVDVPEDRPPEIRGFVLGELSSNHPQWRSTLQSLAEKADVTRSPRALVTIDCIRLLRARLPHAMTLAQVTAPLTIASGLMGYEHMLRLVRKEPELVERVLDICTEVAIQFTRLQLEAGATMLWLGEPMGAVISPAAFARLCSPRLRRILELYPERNILHVCGDTTPHLDQLLSTGARVLSLDSAVDLPALALRVPRDVVLMGNIDPVRVLQQGSARQVQQATTALLDAMEPHDNFILSTGCSMPRTSPMENVRALVETGKERLRTMA